MLNRGSPGAGTASQMLLRPRNLNRRGGPTEELPFAILEVGAGEVVPEFIEVGQPDMVLPDGIHEATPDEVYDAFVKSFPDSGTREDIYVGWSNWRRSVHGLVRVEVEFLDGSFVTNRENPNDVDVSVWIQATDVDGLSTVDQLSLFRLFDNARTKPSFLCDAYLVPKCNQSHPAWADFENQRKWTRRFWKAYRDPAKNIIEGVSKGYLSVTP